MSQSIGILDKTFTAGEDLSSSQYRAIALDASGHAVVADTTDMPIGILQNAPESGEAASVRLYGTSKVVANGAFSIGDLLAVAAADGELDTASGASIFAIGTALEGASKAGVISEMLVDRINLPAVTAGDGIADDGNGELSVSVDDSTIEINADTVRVKDLGITAAKLAAAATYKQALLDSVRGDMTAAPSTKDLGFAVGAGVISRAGFSLANTGADADDALALEMDVTINGVSIFTTKPKLTKAAADGADTFTAGDGVTVGVIDATKDDVVAGDNIAVAWTLTRTTPEDEIADLCGQVDVAYKVGV